MANNGGGSCSKKEILMRLRAAAEEAVKSIGLGYDLTLDLRLKYCKREQSRLIAMDDDLVRDIAVPGGILVQNVPKPINCDKGERMRFSSDVIPFQQMSEQFNQELSLSSKIPTGHLNAAFELTGCWQKDAAFTKSLAFDGVFITLYSIALEKSQLMLRDHVKQAVPSMWDPAALARFIEKYGTHIVVGVKMGGKDVIYVKQHYSSFLQPIEVQKKLKDMANRRFTDACGQSNQNNEKAYGKEKLIHGPDIACMLGIKPIRIE
ncbi:MAC/Perforin domain-containing protein [Striga asiatica]|uniref:MAC/Perforin domain-containing protein n=1 Tax=Striga asiatica TaxID=4170 RepID=A0A5A7QWQ0_STRAF|nr:MAC/Perforin domain-containing protein [Striga asiatica]